jgi:hypothetical protein
MAKPKRSKAAFDPEAQEEIFFTMKVYATKSGSELKSLKYSIDFHPPFEANKGTIAPYASPLLKSNLPIFDRIFDNVKELCRFIVNPTTYNSPKPSKEPWRVKQQRDLEAAIKAANGAINHVTYELNSPPDVTVGVVFSTSGNGDMRPPTA